MRRFTSQTWEHAPYLANEGHPIPEASEQLLSSLDTSSPPAQLWTFAFHHEGAGSIDFFATTTNKDVEVRTILIALTNDMIDGARWKHALIFPKLDTHWLKIVDFITVETIRQNVNRRMHETVVEERTTSHLVATRCAWVETNTAIGSKDCVKRWCADNLPNYNFEELIATEGEPEEHDSRKWSFKSWWGKIKCKWKR